MKRWIVIAISVLCFLININGCDKKAKNAAPLFSNIGNLHHPIVTKSELAQRYFDQGLAFFYGFDYAESIRSFHAAIKEDPNCAMCYWGLALSLGSINNTFIDGTEKKQALAAIKMAIKKVDPLNNSERSYIAALSQRYANDIPILTKSLNQICSAQNIVSHSEAEAYAKAMEKVMLQFPEDTDAAVLWISAIFDLNDWNFWEYDGKPLTNTLQAKQVLERQLQLNPKHIGVNHYWIHLMESSPWPELAIPSAKRLAALAPGAEHLVHMSSHIYLRIGDYHQASICNLNAIQTYQSYIKTCQQQNYEPGINFLKNHNYHFLVAAAMMEGRKSLAIKAARQLYDATPLSWVKRDNLLQSYLPIYGLVLVRFGEWQQILTIEKPSEDYGYAQGLWHYARGMAYVHLNHISEAYVELSELALIERNGITQQNNGKFGYDQLVIAKEVLTAAIAQKELRSDVAIQHLKNAAFLQDHLRYKEPPPWYFPTRQALASILFSQKNYKAAQLVYLEDLRHFPNNGWSLYGLAQCLLQLKQADTANDVMERFGKSWQFAEVAPVVNEVAFNFTAPTGLN